MSDYLEEFRERFRQLDEEHAVRMAMIKRTDRRLRWFFGCIIGVAIVGTLIRAAL